MATEYNEYFTEIIDTLNRELFYEREQIKTQYRQRTFITELLREREWIMFYKERRIRMRE